MPLLVKHRAEDLSTGREVRLAQVHIEHALIRAQVHVTLHPVVEHKDLAVPERIQRA